MRGPLFYPLLLLPSLTFVFVVGTLVLSILESCYVFWKIVIYSGKMLYILADSLLDLREITSNLLDSFPQYTLNTDPN